MSSREGTSFVRAAAVAPVPGIVEGDLRARQGGQSIPDDFIGKQVAKDAVSKPAGRHRVQAPRDFVQRIPQVVAGGKFQQSRVEARKPADGAGKVYFLGPDLLAAMPLEVDDDSGMLAPPTERLGERSHENVAHRHAGLAGQRLSRRLVSSSSRPSVYFADADRAFFPAG